MEVGKLLVRSSFIRVFTTFAKIGVAFFLMPFLIGELGDRWYGIWAIIAGFTGYYFLLDFGLSAAMSRFASKAIASDDRTEVNTVLSTGFFIFTGLGLFVVVVSCAVAYAAKFFLPTPEEIELVRMLILLQGAGMGLNFASKAFGGLTIGHMRFDLSASITLVRVILETIAIFWFLSRGYGILALAVISFIATIVVNIAEYVLAKYLTPYMRVSRQFFSQSLAREMLGFSVWSFVISLANTVRNQIDMAVIAAFLGSAMVTHYQVGARLVMYGLMLLNRATDMFTPLFTRLHTQDDKAGLREKFLLMTKLNTMLGVIGGGLLILLGEAFIRRWMGPDYLDAYPVLLVLSVALITEAICYPSQNMLPALAKHKAYALLTLGEWVVNITLSIILIQQIGIVGVAWGSAIPMVVVRLFLIPIYTCRQLEQSLSEYYLAILPILVLGGLYLLAASKYAADWIQTPEYPVIVASLATLAMIYLLFIPFVGLNKDQRRQLGGSVFGALGLSKLAKR